MLEGHYLIPGVFTRVSGGMGAAWRAGQCCGLSSPFSGSPAHSPVTYLVLNMWCSGAWLSAGLGSGRFPAGLSDPKGLSQAK